MVDEALVPENGDPRVDAHEEVRPEGDDDEEKPQGLVFGAGDAVAAGQRDEDRGDRGHEGHPEGPRGHPHQGRIRHVDVCLEADLRLHAAVEPLFQERVGDDDDEGGGEEYREPERLGSGVCHSVVALHRLLFSTMTRSRALKERKTSSFQAMSGMPSDQVACWRKIVMRAPPSVRTTYLVWKPE